MRGDLTPLLILYIRSDVGPLKNNFSQPLIWEWGRRRNLQEGCKDTKQNIEIFL